MDSFVPSADLSPAVGTEALPVLRALVDHDCRFVVIGSTARRLCGTDVVPADLDLVVDPDPALRPGLVAALASIDATIERRHGTRSIADSLHLPWDWGWRSDTVHGSIDVIIRFVDGTDIEHHDALAFDVGLAADLIVRCHPTEHPPTEHPSKEDPT